MQLVKMKASKRTPHRTPPLTLLPPAHRGRYLAAFHETYGMFARTGDKRDVVDRSAMVLGLAYRLCRRRGA